MNARREGQQMGHLALSLSMLVLVSLGCKHRQTTSAPKEFINDELIMTQEEIDKSKWTFHMDPALEGLPEETCYAYSELFTLAEGSTIEAAIPLAEGKLNTKFGKAVKYCCEWKDSECVNEGTLSDPIIIGGSILEAFWKEKDITEPPPKDEANKNLLGGLYLCTVGTVKVDYPKCQDYLLELEQRREVERKASRHLGQSWPLEEQNKIAGVWVFIGRKKEYPATSWASGKLDPLGDQEVRVKKTYADGLEKISIVPVKEIDHVRITWGHHKGKLVFKNE